VQQGKHSAADAVAALHCTGDRGQDVHLLHDRLKQEDQALQREVAMTALVVKLRNADLVFLEKREKTLQLCSNT